MDKIEESNEENGGGSAPESLADAIAQAVDSAPSDDAMIAATGVDEADGEADEAEAEADVVDADPDKAKAAATADDAAQPDGDDDLTVPPDLKGRTRERFERLTARLKEASEKTATAMAFADRWRETVASTGASPEYIGKTLEFVRAIHSGDVKQLESALSMLDETRASIAKALGKDVPGVDVLADFPDLADGVASGDLGRAHALELARVRRQAAAVEQQRGKATAEQQRDQLVNEGAQAVDAFMESMKATDPMFGAKMALLKPVLASVARNAPPDRWAAEVAELYRNVPVQAPPAPKENPQPFRAARPSGVGGGRPAAAPASMLDAITAVLG